MIVEKRISIVRLVRLIWMELVLILIVATIPVVILMSFNFAQYAINASIPLIIGTAIAIFLGFRTNSAYDCWWEARKLWGGVVNDSRNLVRLCDSMIGSISEQSVESDRKLVKEIAYRQIAWTQLMGRQLKGQPQPTGLDRLLNERDLSEIQDARDPVLALMARQSESILAALRAGRIDTRQMVLIEETIGQLNNHYGGCQRIKSTVFPVHYRFFTRLFIWIFLGLLGFSLPAHENANYFLIPAIFLIGWVFLMVEGIGNYMQDPFENNRNVIPMDAISRTIERNLREALRETDLPDPIEPIDGALY